MKTQSESGLTELQKINYKFMGLSFIVLVFALIAFYYTYHTVSFTTAHSVYHKLDALGYEITNLSSDYENDETVVQSFCASKDDVFIYFYEMDRNETAAALVANYVSGHRRNPSDVLAGRTDAKDRQAYYFESAVNFYAVQRVNTIVLYTSSYIFDKEMAMASIEKILPPNLTNMMILIGVGGICIFLAMGFHLQEFKKRGRCTMKATAKVISNEKILMDPVGRKKGSVKRYGSSKAYTYSPVLTYQLANREMITVTYDNGLPKPIAGGTKIDIYYNSQDPLEFCFVDRKIEWPLFILTAVVILLGLIFIGYPVFRLIRAF